MVSRNKGRMEWIACCVVLTLGLAVALPIRIPMTETGNVKSDIVARFGRSVHDCTVNFKKNVLAPPTQKTWMNQQYRLHHIPPTTEHPTGTYLWGHTERPPSMEPPGRPDADTEYLPYFDAETETNVTAQAGTTGYLMCRIYQLGDRSVSWVRQDLIHILTVDLYTYSNDERLVSKHPEGTDDWILEVKYVNKTDEGTYECQLTTEPKLCLAIKLRVVVARASILEGSSVYIGSDTKVNLTCVIKEYALSAIVSPVYVYWTHNGIALDEVAKMDGRVQIWTEVGNTTTSVLHIGRTRPSDAGVYACVASYAEPVNATLFVLEGEKPSAMLHDRTNASIAKTSVLSLWTVALIFLMSLHVL